MEGGAEDPAGSDLFMTENIDSTREDFLRARLSEMLDAYDTQCAHVMEVHQALSLARCTVTSSDGLVTLTVNSAGIPVDVRVAQEAFRKSNPQRLGQTFLQVARAAAAAAYKEAERISAPLTEVAGTVPDLPDLVPGAPSLLGLRTLLHGVDSDVHPGSPS